MPRRSKGTGPPHTLAPAGTRHMATQTQTKSGSKAGSYIQEVVKESKKVNWPKRRELINNTVLTLVFALVISLFIFGADQVISSALSLIY